MPASWPPGSPPPGPTGNASALLSDCSPVPIHTSSCDPSAAAPNLTWTAPHASAAERFPIAVRSDSWNSSSGVQVSPRSAENHTPPVPLAA